VQSGTSVIDNCATKCMAYVGSFVDLTSDADFEFRGVSVFDYYSAQSAFQNSGGRVSVSWSNCTSLMGRWASYEIAAALHVQWEGASLTASFLLIADCSSAYGCFSKWLRTLRHLSGAAS
jgi:hypothetical protein